MKCQAKYHLKYHFINCKVELKLKCTKSFVIAAAGVDNDNANDNSIIFTIKDAKLYVPVFTLSAKDNQKLLELLSKGFGRSVYWNEYKTKSENENTTKEYRYFLESNFIGVNKLFVFVYSNRDNNAKKYKVLRYDLPKELLGQTYWFWYETIRRNKKVNNKSRWRQDVS